ncbi:carboxypeptidase-like regulatory domain-containing protein [Microbulbifer sp. CNSA002]|uniref:carboxypeptidase-like regulatory domain-containing protein n=1 Tax=Microbulbifer sp. CNSA002 TaxID=3373604 RepID=UPI0039B59EAA
MINCVLKIELSFFTLWLIASCASVNAKSYVIEGQVSSTSGSPLNGLRVSLSKKNDLSYPSFKEIEKAVSDNKGRFLFTVERRGEYLVEVWHPRKYVVVSGRTVTIDHEETVKLSLQVDEERLD